MRAVVQSRYGPPEVLEVAEISAPSVGVDEVLVAVRASAVTQGDRRLRTADFPGFLKYIGRLATGVFRPRHRVPGTNFAGDVVAVGEQVTRFAPGDEVFGAAMHGTHAQKLCVAEEGPIAPMPSGMTYDEVVDLPYGAGTALTFLRDLGEIDSGDRVLVVGAAGGVGRYAVQLASHFGAKVTGICHTEDAELVRELGADAVIDYTTEDFTEKGGTWNIILDTSGTVGFETARESLDKEGALLGLIVSLKLILYSIWTWATGGRRAIAGVADESRETLEEIRDLAEQGLVRPMIDRRYPLDRVRDAHRRLESGKGRGSVVLTMPEP